MKKVLKLAFAYLREHPVRTVLTSIATALSVCMVVWVASGYDSLIITFDNFANRALGRYQLSVAPISTTAGEPVPQKVLADLKADPAVIAVEPMWAKQANVTVKDPGPNYNPNSEDEGLRRRGPGGPPGDFRGRGGRPQGPPRRDPMILAGDFADSPFELLRGTWLDPSRPEELNAVLSENAAKRLGVDIDGTIRVGREGKTCLLRVTGIMDVPTVTISYGNTAMKILSPGIGEIFVTSAIASRIHGSPPIAAFAGVAVSRDADINAFRFGWGPKLSRYSVPVQFQEAHDIEEALDESAAAENVQLQSYAVTGIAVLVALLVVFCTLNMGVNERVRQFAILRAVTFTRSQVAILIVIEALFLGTIGFAGGLLLGWAMLLFTGRVFSQMLHHGTSIGLHTLLLAAIVSYGAALIASIIPVRRVTRVKPVDAMAPSSGSSESRGLRLSIVATGFLLILVNPILAFAFPLEFGRGILILMAAGFISMGVGFVLLAPIFVAFADRVAGPFLAYILRIKPRLVASQMSSSLWRTIGAAVSLSVGLGLFIAVQVWGYSMLDAFLPGNWVPDAICLFSPDGISPAEASKMGSIPGVDPELCLPVVVEQPFLLKDLTNSGERASVIRQNNVIIAGVNPERALGGDRPLLKFEWVQGTSHKAVELMMTTRGCVVPEHFLRETGLKLGDTFAVVPPDKPEKPVTYTIAGSVRLPGWHWQTKHTSFRPRNHRAAALIFSNYDTVAEDFGLKTASHIWFSYDESTEVDPERIAAAAGQIYSGILGSEVGINVATTDAPYVRVVPVEDIRRMTLGAASRWIWIISAVPGIALVVACFGVLNVMLASVQARRWNMGVLRAIGFTSSELVRAVIAEGLLIGTIACLLSLGIGILAGWCGCQFAQYISFFGGMNPSLVVPALPILIGICAALLLSALTALWPAISVGRTRPLTLLQQGRGTL